MTPPDGRKKHDDATTRRAPLGPKGPPAAHAYRLSVTDGPDRGAELRIDGSSPSRVLVGQSSACAMKLADVEVSRRHLALDLDERGLHLTDLGSTNGTWINGLRVDGAHLAGGEEIRLGRTTLRVLALGQPAKFDLPRQARFGRVVGASVAMRRLYPLCARLALSEVAVVIEGETGTGKELLAESIHEASPRSEGPFVVLDCTAIAPTLVESMLFGHERGAFTGATGARKGVFEQAHGGTLLIDEIGDLDVALQAKLLRAIERGEVQPVGSQAWRKVNVRVLAATRRDLDREVQAGRFRDDLLFRLGAARVELPPLRERHGDVGILARHFWHVMGGDPEAFPEDLLPSLEDYAWPGNVRELHNRVAMRLALGDVADLMAPTPSAGPRAAAADDLVDAVLSLDLPFPRARQQVLADFERRYVERVLARHGGNVAKAAAASGIGRRYFHMLRSRQPK